MRRLIALLGILLIGAVAGTVNAQTIVCDGKAAGGTGVVSYDAARMG